MQKIYGQPATSWPFSFMKIRLSIIVVSILIAGAFFLLLQEKPTALRVVVEAVHCGSVISVVKTNQGIFRLPFIGREDGPMPVRHKNGRRELWNTSSFCKKETFVNGIVGKPFLITYDLFHTIRTWEEL